jgi:glycosyltransferase involved in cell wall biosynthesis
MQTHKGFESVIDAVLELRQNGIPAHGVIVSQVRPDAEKSSEYLEKLQAYSNTVGGGAWVKFVTEYVSDEAIGEYLAASDLVMLNYKSLHIESSGACALAVGAGAVVATSLAPSMLAFGDAVWHITSGYSPAISALLLLQDKVLRTEILVRAAQYRAQHSWARMAERFGALYQSLGVEVSYQRGVQVVCAGEVHCAQMLEAEPHPHRKINARSLCTFPPNVDKENLCDLRIETLAVSERR